jgi:hypothetical protein
MEPEEILRLLRKTFAGWLAIYVGLGCRNKIKSNPKK